MQLSGISAVTTLPAAMLPSASPSGALSTSNAPRHQPRVVTAVSAAALTVYDMCKAVQRDITITDVCLLEKSGGKSGEYRREEGCHG